MVLNPAIPPARQTRGTVLPRSYDPLVLLSTTHFPLASSVVPGKKLSCQYLVDVQGISYIVVLNIALDLLHLHDASLALV